MNFWFFLENIILNSCLWNTPQKTPRSQKIQIKIRSNQTWWYHPWEKMTGKRPFPSCQTQNEQWARNESQKDMKIYKKLDTIKSNLDLLLLLKSQFHQIRIHLAEILLITILWFLALLSRLGRHHNNTCRPLGGSGSTELGSRCDKDVGNTVILAQDGDVADDVQRRDICCKDNDANGFGDGCVGCWGGTFAEGFDDFFDASFEGFVDSGCNIR